MSLVSNDSQLPVGLGSSTTGMEAKYRVTEVVRDLHDGGSFH
ncbi:MAG: hypothetical protein K0S47_2680 [Herbinix sp.]|nr:hypothetical protein [Herbinix sp.]